jgi:hypothetical protein
MVCEVIVFIDIIPLCETKKLFITRIKKMSTVNSSQNISTSKSIRKLGLPARQQRKALESLALVDALISPFFAEADIKADSKKTPAAKPVLKVQ